MISETAEVDVLKVAIESVAEALGGGVWVADHLPAADHLGANLPAVIIDLLPGAEVVPWGGNHGDSVMDTLSLDVEVLAKSRAAATPVASQVRRALHQLPFLEGTGVKRVDCPRLATREEINPYVKVLGVVADLAVSPV